MFDLFVIFAEMRTGSNLLEETLNQVEGITSHGEVFNPVHIGGPNRSAVLETTRAERDADPAALLARLRAAPGLNGFRYFHDHDPRVLAEILSDPRCAKIILSRNPVESYVSLKIARETGRWRAADARPQRAVRPSFDRDEFAAFLDARQAFRRQLHRGLQVSGQTAFHLDYEDVQSVPVLNGVLRFLGVEGEVTRISRKLIPQNPEPLSHKVRNFAEMERALATFDWAALSCLPNFEPRRGPGVPRAVAATGAPLLFLPLPGIRDDAVRAWLSQMGGGVTKGFTQGTLRDWMRDRPGHRSFTVVSHPLLRAYTVFRHVLADDDFEGLRIGLKQEWSVPIPSAGTMADLAPQDERAAFLGFLRFLRANLQGQTPVQQHSLWASQSLLIEGMAQFMSPDLIARSETLAADLDCVVRLAGLPAQPGPLTDVAADERVGLSRFCDRQVEAAAYAAYARDYQLLGYARELPAS